jgi:DNA invertase Pin-like site-specific DNA recombinase
MKHELAGTPVLDQILTRQKAIIYCRISTQQQATRGDGLGSQEAVCRQYAERMGYEVIEVFRDTVTGSITERPAMQAMLKFLPRHKARGVVVLVDHPNRFSRDVRGHWDLRDLLKAAGGKLESPNMTFGESPADILLENVMMSAAQYQRQQNAEQVRARQKGRLLQGFWPFIPPRAMRHERMEGVGNVLVRIEPEASVIAEGLEAFACGRLRSKAEFARWLNDHPQFGKGRRTRVTNQQAHDLLTNPLYGGVVEKPDWGVSRRKAKHQGLVSYETFERIEARLNEKTRMGVRADVSADFPLRGSVACAHCEGPLTACWSRSKTGEKHAYYFCFARGCTEYRKSIRRDRIEGEFAAMLEALTPKPALLAASKAIFRSAWDQRETQARAASQLYQRQIAEVDHKIAALLDRLVDASSATVIGAFEKRIGELERSKLVLEERKANCGKPLAGFDEMFELAFGFLANPSKLWRLGRLELQRTVLRLAFADRLAYARNDGFRTPKTTMPFKVLGSGRGPFDGMAERKGNGNMLVYTYISNR